MLLAIDMGNTNITIGVYENETLKFEVRLATDRTRTSDQYAIELKDVLRLHNCSPTDIDGAIISSVVPEISFILRSAIKKAFGVEALMLSEGIETGLEIAIDTKSSIGDDLIAASVGAKAKYKMPCLVIDMGTATKIIVLNENGAFCGCTIAPGMGISLEALSSGTSQLPRISFSAPQSTIGKNTVECMQSGLIFGNAAMLDGMTKRICAETDYDAKVVATGGYCKYVVGYCEQEIEYDKNLVLDGLMEIYKMNK